MKKILCDNKKCTHNEDVELCSKEGKNTMSVCARCDDIKINAYHDKCDGYESIEHYLKRIEEDE